MTTIPSETLLDSLRWRYATKRFDPKKKISNELWIALEQALVLAPSSYGLQPWKFIVVSDPAMRLKLSLASWGQTQPVDCSHYVVFALRKNLGGADVDRFIDRMVEVRGGTAEGLKGYRDIMVGATDKARKTGTLDAWMACQVYIALGQFMTSAALLGIDTCPMEGIDPPEYDAALGLSAQGLTALCACAAGYRAEGDRHAALPKVRFKTAEVVSYV